MPYNFSADSFHTKKLCSRLSSSEVRFFTEIGRLAFLRPPFGGLRDNVERSSWVRWKACSGLPISVNWTFFARCYGWGATGEYRLKIGDFAPTGSVDPKFQVEVVAPHRPFFFSKNYAKWSFVWCKNLDRSFYRFVTIHACDRRRDGQTDGQTEFSSLYRVCVPCSAVKIRKRRIQYVIQTS